MTDKPYRVHLRRRRTWQHNPGSKLALSVGLVLSMTLAIASILLALVYADITRDLPSVDRLSILLDPPAGLLRQPTQIYDRSGQVLLAVLRNPATVPARYLPYPSLPVSLIEATLAISDPAFWQHAGFSLKQADGKEQGTLAERLAGDLLLPEENPGLRHDLRVSYLAAQATARFGREKILEWYLNSTYYGQLAFGVDAAAQLYLDKSATELDPAEAALLAAITGAPALNPLDAPQAAIERQQALIGVMVEQGLLSNAEARQMLDTRLELRRDTDANLEPTSLAPAFTNMVRAQLVERFGQRRVEQGGLRVLTTLDFSLQFQAACTAATQIARLAGELPPVQTLPGYTCEADRLLPSFPGLQNITQADLSANLVALDPGNGQVLAMVGEANAPALLSGRPGGSLLTPFVYLSAMTRGFSPASLVWDTPDGLTSAALENFEGAYHGPMRLRVALANDFMAPASKTLMQVGADTTWRIARQMGLSTLQPEVSASEYPFDELNTTLLEAAQAYGVFSNNGVLVGQLAGPGRTGITAAGELPHLYPITILRVEDFSGRLVWRSSAPQTRPVITPQLAYLMTHILSDEPARWTSLGHPNSLEIGRPAAAKLGRTQDGRENWTVGYTPQLVIGTWVGKNAEDAGEPLPYYASAGLWHAVMQNASREQAYQDWPVPQGISSQTVCATSGMLPTANCPALVDEVFILGSEPTQADTLYQAVAISQATGKLATIFTPLHLVENKVFMNLPESVLGWARQVGLEIPPQDYDVLSLPPQNAQVSIQSPEMFAAVRGQVEIRGRAAGDNFASYRIQTGAGLNPQGWYLVGQDHNQPVRDGVLASWDTRELTGMYAIQLLVKRQDGQLESSTLLVTVDNLAPSLRILYPLPGQEVRPGPTKAITLQIEASDNLELREVSVYIDDKLVTSLQQAPYAWSWPAKEGLHTLRVVATDRAGNTQEETLQFRADLGN